MPVVRPPCVIGDCCARVHEIGARQLARMITPAMMRNLQWRSKLTAPIPESHLRCVVCSMFVAESPRRPTPRACGDVASVRPRRVPLPLCRT